tara:strand:- start:1934 stop:2041 length:108 start_codon:yes stop_codon:yes gene_type:complete
LLALCVTTRSRRLTQTRRRSAAVLSLRALAQDAQP